MFSAITKANVQLVNRYLPFPFVFSIVLTFILNRSIPSKTPILVNLSSIKIKVYLSTPRNIPVQNLGDNRIVTVILPALALSITSTIVLFQFLHF